MSKQHIKRLRWIKSPSFSSKLNETEEAIYHDYLT